MNRPTIPRVGESSEPVEEGYEWVNIGEEVDPAYAPMQFVPPGPLEDVFQTARVNTTEVLEAARNAYEAHLREHVEITLENLHEAAKSAAIYAAVIATATATITAGVAIQGLETSRDALYERFQHSSLGYNLCLRLDEYRMNRLRQVKRVRDQIWGSQRRYKLKERSVADRESIAVVSERVDELPRRGDGRFLIGNVDEPPSSMTSPLPDLRLWESESTTPRAYLDLADRFSLETPLHASVSNIDGWKDGWNDAEMDREVDSDGESPHEHDPANNHGEKSVSKPYSRKEDLMGLENTIPNKALTRPENTHDPTSEIAFGRAFNLFPCSTDSSNRQAPVLAETSIAQPMASVMLSPSNQHDTNDDETISEDKESPNHFQGSLMFDSITAHWEESEVPSVATLSILANDNYQDIDLGSWDTVEPSSL